MTFSDFANRFTLADFQKLFLVKMKVLPVSELIKGAAQESNKLQARKKPLPINRPRSERPNKSPRNGRKPGQAGYNKLGSVFFCSFGNMHLDNGK